MNIRFVLVAATCCLAAPSFADFAKGDKLVTIANLHPDMQRHVLFTTNVVTLSIGARVATTRTMESRSMRGGFSSKLYPCVRSTAGRSHRRALPF